MLRRKPGSLRPADPIDRELVEGVEAELPWHVLVRSASCPPDEADQRLRRLLRADFLEGTAGDTPPSRTSLAPVRFEGAPSLPAPRSSAPPSVAPVAGSRGASLLRELRAQRGGTSQPPPERTRTPARSAPARRSLPPKTQARCAISSPLGALIDELALGEGIRRWSAARLREALEEELAGNYLQAVAIVQLVLSQLDEPRIRKESARLSEKSLSVSSGVYRSRAIEAERARKHREAADEWRKVCEALPSDLQAALHAAKNYMEAGELKQGAHFARRAAQLAPSNVNAHKLLLHFFQRTGMEANAQRERTIIKKLKQA